MSNNDFVGNPILSFDKELNNYFGFIYCKVETPDNLDIPILPFRGDDGCGSNTIYFPLGN
jgi:hypothetical protein